MAPLHLSQKINIRVLPSSAGVESTAMSMENCPIGSGCPLESAAGGRFALVAFASLQPSHGRLSAFSSASADNLGLIRPSSLQARTIFQDGRLIRSCASIAGLS